MNAQTERATTELADMPTECRCHGLPGRDPERAFLGDEAFAAQYGGGASAFGKCVGVKR